VVFKDGETIVGSTTAYDGARPGFFMTPADPQSNNDRIYVVARGRARRGLHSVSGACTVSRPV
jgi:hypothetical protein